MSNSTYNEEQTKAKKYQLMKIEVKLLNYSDLLIAWTVWTWWRFKKYQNLSVDCESDRPRHKFGATNCRHRQPNDEFGSIHFLKEIDSNLRITALI